MLTVELMRQMWPQGNSKVPGLMEGIVTSAPAVFAKYGLNDDLVIAQAMAQFSHECGGGTEMVENLNYRADALLSQWPSHFTPTQAQAMAHNQQAIANQAYNGRMGNRAGTDDGWNYRGRGLSQTTGRDAYEKLGQIMQVDLLGIPDLVNAPGTALECAVADFVKICNCLGPAAADDVTTVTRRLNGGLIGLDQRKQWLERWRAALSNPTAAAGASDSGSGTAHDTLWLQQSLNTLGADPQLKTDGVAGPATIAAVKAFQTSQGLTADGVAGPQTIAAIEAALPAG
jgi:putative chitinase